ncbi:hypothetical protein GCM10017771_11930 [Streptomyces capitiformicae]|uniref:Uncharacterized protein n=1 Tax=Streptomyces capitiformicae TaxID=2014920 RepID=A0A919L4Q5_9ACTN|nr:hypothetical protein GCM10017771_11930 [Streptomyces capitiformicae]
MKDGGQGQDEEGSGAGADEAVVEADADPREADRGEDAACGDGAGGGGGAEGGAEITKAPTASNTTMTTGFRMSVLIPAATKAPAVEPARAARPIRTAIRTSTGVRRAYSPTASRAWEVPPSPRRRADDRDRLLTERVLGGRGAVRQTEEEREEEQQPAATHHGVDPSGREGGEAQDDDHGQRYVGHDRDPMGRGRCAVHRPEGSLRLRAEAAARARA